MFKLNRKKEYEIIKEIIKNTDSAVIDGLVAKEHDDTFDAEYRKNELLEYLDEMNTCWNMQHVDVTDRQYMKVLKPTPEETLTSVMSEMKNEYEINLETEDKNFKENLKSMLLKLKYIKGVPEEKKIPLCDSECDRNLVKKVKITTEFTGKDEFDNYTRVVKHLVTYIDNSQKTFNYDSKLVTLPLDFDTTEEDKKLQKIL